MKTKSQKSKQANRTKILKIKKVLRFFLYVPVLALMVFGSLFLTPTVHAAAGINKQINFQGKLVDGNGLNVANGTYSIIFSLYTVSSAGTAIWTETDSVVISNGDGIFQVPLGAVTTLPGSVDFNTDNIYLGIKISTEVNEMTPRVRFTAVPYAFNADKIHGLTVTDTTGSLTIANGKTLTANSSATIAGVDAKTLTLNDSTTLGTNAITFAGGASEILTLSANKGVTFADSFSTAGAFATTLTSAGVTDVTLPTTGTLLTNTASANQTITSTQTTGTVWGITDATNIGAAIVGDAITLSGIGAFDQTGLQFNLSGATGANLNDIVGTGSTWKVSRGGALTVASCTGCGGGGATALSAITSATSSPAALANANFGQTWNWGTLTTQTGMTFGGGTAMTTGSELVLGGATYVHTALNDVGSLSRISFTDASTNANNGGVTNGLNIAPTINTSGAGTKTINAINTAAPSITGCATGACTLNGLQVNTITAGAASTITSNGLNVVATGVGSGNLNGLNISGITAGAGAETAINIGSGWDTGISITTSAAEKAIQLTAGAVPTTDMFNITNAGQGVITAGVNALSINYVGGAAAVESAGARIDLTGGTTAGAGAIWSGLRTVMGTVTSGTTVNDLKLETAAFTQTSTNTTNINGLNLATAGSLVQNTAAGTINWTGNSITTPNITQTTGTITSTGLNITLGTITTGGTSTGLKITGTATSPTAGTFEKLINAVDSAGNSVFEVRDLSAANNNFGAAVTSGAFIQRNSYFGEEYNSFRGANCIADTVQSRGDYGNPSPTACTANAGELSAYVTLGVSGSCTVSSIANAVGGQERLSAAGAIGGSASCMESLGSATANVNQANWTATNLPVMVMKFKPSGVGIDQRFFMGFGTLTDGSLSMPTNGIFFSNCSASATCDTTLRGVVTVASVVTSVSCGTLTAGNSIYTRVEVRSATDVHFFADLNTADGIVETECGTGLTTTPSGAISVNLVSAANGALTQNIDIDYFRIWQDDNIETRIASGETAVATTSAPVADYSGSSSLAQIFPSDASYTSGTLVGIDSSDDMKIKPTDRAYDGHIIGVVVNDPRVVIDNGTVGGAKVATHGRALVNVSTQNGSIKSGDYLTSSSIPGVAMKASKAGQIIGQALSSYSGEGIGQVNVLINISSYNGTSLADLPGLTEDGSVASVETPEFDIQLLSYFLQKKDHAALSDGISEILTDRLAAGLEIITPKITTQTIALDKIQAATGKDIGLTLSDEGQLIIKNSAGGAGIRFDSKGNAFFAGTITADKIRANQIEGLEILTNRISSLEGHIASNSADLSLLSASTSGKPSDIVASSSSVIASSSATPPSSSAGSHNDGLSLASLNVDGLATVSADLRVKGNGLVEGILNVIDTLTAKNLIVSQIADFFGNVIFHKDVTFAGRATFNKDTAGYILIKKDSDRAEVKFDKEYDAEPVINASLVSDKLTEGKFTLLKNDETCDASQDISVCQDKVDKAILDENNKFIITKSSTHGFVILLQKKAGLDMKISWNALSVIDREKVSAAAGLGGENK